MLSYYIDKGANLDTLVNLDYWSKQFYIASMKYREEKEADKFRL